MLEFLANPDLPFYLLAFSTLSLAIAVWLHVRKGFRDAHRR